MATEVKPTTGTIWLKNLVMEKGVSVGAATTQQLYSPASYLLNPLRTRRWRSTGLATASVDIDLGASYTPGAAAGIRCFGLVDCNVFPGLTVALKSIDGIGGSVVSTWSYTTYTRARVNQTMRWYVGNHDGGAAGAASRYWRVELPTAFAIGGDDPDELDLFLQIGVVWLGDYTEIGYDLGTRIRAKDLSEESESREGDKYHDRLGVIHMVDLSVPLLEAATLYPVLKEGLDRAGATGRVMLDLHAISTTDHERAHGCFYGRVLNSGQNLKFSLHGDLAIDFEEDARG